MVVVEVEIAKVTILVSRHKVGRADALALTARGRVGSSATNATSAN